jgi:hypothetical protein
MNELPSNIFPKIMESDSSFDQKQETSTESEDDEEDVGSVAKEWLMNFF